MSWNIENRVLRFELLLPRETPSNNVIKGMHFQVYRKTRRLWQMEILASLKGKLPAQPIGASFLEIERACAGSLDWDNAYGGLKPVLDCLVLSSGRNPDGLGLIVDDSPKHMPWPPFMTQVTAKKKAGSTRIRIYELIGI